VAKLEDVLKDELVENEDDVAKLLDTEYEELSMLLEPNGPNTLLAVIKEAVWARLADVLNDELVLKELDKA
jgi:hypothetical protein